MPLIPQIEVISVRRKDAPDGIIYSTKPRVGIAENNAEFILKGPEAEIVVPEALSAQLLRTVQLPKVHVPSFAAVRVAGEEAQNIYFGSSYLDVISQVAPHLAAHRDYAAAIVVADIWLCSKDRNIGNFLLDYNNDLGKFLVAIDFGGSVAAQFGATLRCGEVKTRQLWPLGDAGTILGRLPWPEETISAIERIDETTIRTVAMEVAFAFPCFTWVDGAVQVLKQRASQIQRLAKQVWNDCNR